MFTVHFAVTVAEARPTDFVFVTGSEEGLGSWDPTRALRLEPNEEGVFVGSVNLGDIKQLKFRYFLGYYLYHDATASSLIIRKWETHLSARCVLPAVEATKNGICRAKVNDVFGFHAGRQMLSDGWLIQDPTNAIHLTVTGEALKFYKSKHVCEKYRIKVTPMDLRNRDDTNPLDDDGDDTNDEPATPILSYSPTEIAPLGHDEPYYKLQNEFGEVFTNGTDYAMFRTYSVAVDYLGFKIEVFKATEDKLVAIGYALPSTLLNTYGKTSVPLLTTKGMPVGKIYLEYLFIRPIRTTNLTFSMDRSFIKHWKKRTTLEVGHRGMGNSYTQFAVARENTLHSLNRAAKHGADYVEFDVQLTKDRKPVIYHDFHVMVSVAKRSENEDKHAHQLAIKDLNMDQISLLHLDHVKHQGEGKDLENVTKVTPKALDEAADLQPFPTLEDALLYVDADVGFNVELKFPMIQADGIHECENYFEYNEFLDVILAAVFQNAKNRRIVFSSFCPDICMMIAAKQNKYPVLFLCCGSNTRHQVYQDIRTTTSLMAVNFAAASGILGVNFHSEDVLRDATPIAKAKQYGLISFVWGDELNNKDTVEYFKKVVGVDGVIYDRIGEMNPRASVFSLERAKKSELFGKKQPPSPVGGRANSAMHLFHRNSESNGTIEKFENDAYNVMNAYDKRHNGAVEWPIASKGPSRRRSPTAEDLERYFVASHGLIDGYMPRPLDTAARQA
uniref:GP-PDE domain-containing protein n=1 Tax=Panagrellus redivivus TaxID=6233 RepID=A0A7E4ZZ24_PANRE